LLAEMKRKGHRFVGRWLVSEASAAARWLGLVPFDRSLDERNDPPVLPEEDGADIAPGIR
jgi:hypothetical protein